MFHCVIYKIMIMFIEGNMKSFIVNFISDFIFSWYKLTNKEGKADKDRGEIYVSLQFYSKNNTTGSVLDLTTKNKHRSLKEIKQTLSKTKILFSMMKKKKENVGLVSIRLVCILTLTLKFIS